MKTTDVIYREDLYPRSLTDPSLVQQYAQDLSVLPPIEVNQHGILIDGWHRWTAHKKEGKEEIEATVTETSSEAELFRLAIVRNAKHGKQLSQADKRSCAVKIYLAASKEDRSLARQQLMESLSVSKRTIDGWLEDVVRAEKEERDRKIRDMWLACYTQDEIADELKVDQKTVSRVSGEIAKLQNCLKSQFSEEDWQPPVDDVWTKTTKTNEVNHFGNTEAQWLENLLYLYTAPFDVVVDPFAGGGSTIDVCKRRWRRYYVSDRKPIVEREKEIRPHDIANGLPAVPRWEDVALVYLDPPYWRQAAGKYSEDPTDLANMDADAFHETLVKLIRDFSMKLRAGAHIAMAMQDTMWNAPERRRVSHAFKIALELARSKASKVDLVETISAPYTSQQFLPQMVEWAKENKRILVRSRTITIWEVK